MSLSRDQFKSLHRDLMSSPGQEGGFSINVATGQSPTEGHMVSYPGSEHLTSPASATKPSHLARYVRKHREGLSMADSYFGGWKPDTAEFTTLDRSQNIRPNPKITKRYGYDVADADALTSALDLGVSRNQFSVYSIKRDRSPSTGIDREL